MNAKPMTAAQIQRIDYRRLIAFLAISLIIMGAAPVFAQGFDLTSAVQPVATGAIATVKAIAVIIVIAGFIMFGAGRMHYAGGFLIIVGLVGIGRAQAIATALTAG
jgi:hypothetical protein